MFHNLLLKYRTSRDAYRSVKREALKGSTLTWEILIGLILTTLAIILISYSVLGVVAAGLFFYVIPYIAVVCVIGALFMSFLKR